MCTNQKWRFKNDSFFLMNFAKELKIITDLLKFLAKFNIKIRNCVGGCFGKADNMIGKEEGIQANLKRAIPNLLNQY